MNNKGFTLIELLATIVLLAIIMTVTTVTIINLIDSSKKKSYELLVENIKIAAQGYFEECENKSIIDSNITCPTINASGTTKTMISSFTELLDYGFLKATDIDGTNKKILNPIDNTEIGCCNIEIKKEIDNFNVTYSYVFFNSGCAGTCPTG